MSDIHPKVRLMALTMRECYHISADPEAPLGDMLLALLTVSQFINLKATASDLFYLINARIEAGL